MAEICQHLEAHRNESGTIDDLARTLLRFDIGLVRNVPIGDVHVTDDLLRSQLQVFFLDLGDQFCEGGGRFLSELCHL